MSRNDLPVTPDAAAPAAMLRWIYLVGSVMHVSRCWPPSTGVKISGHGRRLGAYALDVVLLFICLFVVYAIWWLFTIRNGQTPGKQLLGIRVIRADGTPSGWGSTFIREFLIKWLLVGVLTSFLVVAWPLDLAWTLWDKDRQTLHDKIMNTLVVDDRGLINNVRAEPTLF